MKKIYLVLLINLGLTALSHGVGEVTVINKIIPKNGAFVGIVDSSQTLVSTQTFSGNLSSADTDVQKALNTLDGLSISSGGGVSDGSNSGSLWVVNDDDTVSPSSATFANDPFWDLNANGEIVPKREYAWNLVPGGSFDLWLGSYTPSSGGTSGGSTTTISLDPLAFSTSAGIYFDTGLQNLSFYDSQAGTITLSDMDCPKYLMIKSSGMSEGNMSLSSSAWNANKAEIKYIVVKTTSTNYDVYLRHSNTAYGVAGAHIDDYPIMLNGNGDSFNKIDLPYYDESNVASVHLYINDYNGIAKSTVTVLGYKLR